MFNKKHIEYGNFVKNIKGKRSDSLRCLYIKKLKRKASTCLNKFESIISSLKNFMYILKKKFYIVKKF